MSNKVGDLSKLKQLLARLPVKILARIVGRGAYVNLTNYVTLQPDVDVCVNLCGGGAIFLSPIMNTMNYRWTAAGESRTFTRRTKEKEGRKGVIEAALAPIPSGTDPRELTRIFRRLAREVLNEKVKETLRRKARERLAG